MFLVPIWINVKVISKYPTEAHKKEREQWFGGSFELFGFKNGAPIYCNLNKDFFIYYYDNRCWHMCHEKDFERDEGRFYFMLTTSGLILDYNPVFLGSFK